MYNGGANKARRCIKERLEAMRKNETYITVKSITNLDEYFEKHRVILEAERASLKREIESIKNE
jgi:hypothetical protein